MSNRVKKYLAWISADDTEATPLALLAAEGTEALPTHLPPLTDREEAIYLLHIAAEVEHALMVQYLYAAFSLGGPQVPAEKRDEVAGWRKTITDIAREEMGHLATVQNILQILGGPLVFEREDFPIPAGLYPFTFTLEPLTLGSLGNYVLAEMPDLKTLSEGDRKYVEAILASSPHPINRVGMIYERIIELIGDIPATEFDANSLPFQASGDEWGLGYSQMLVLQAGDRDEARKALTAVAEQGEAAGIPQERLMPPSHFRRFLEIHQAFPKGGEWQPSRPLPNNPVVPQRGLVLAENQTPITNEETSKWAQLANLRYWVLLAGLSHAFLTPSANNSGSEAPERPSVRGLLVSWAFGEMYHLRSLGDILAGMSLDPEGTRLAGIPFEMPYTVVIPERERDRWRHHRDLLVATGKFVDKLLESPGDHESYLKGMKRVDKEALAIINGILNA